MRNLNLVLLVLVAPQAACVAPGQPDTPAVSFTEIQPVLFRVAGSLSNAWADFDGDGDLDFAVSIKGGEIRLYRNHQGQFSNVGALMGLPTTGDEIRGLSWGDYDSDGDLDLVAGSNVSPIPSRSYVYRNDGEHFTEVAEEIGLATLGRRARQTNWLDYDNDGDLDLYAADRSGWNRLYRNDQGKFVGLPFGQAPIDPRRTVGACWFDVDRDGDLDLFLANQNGDSDAMWRNDGASFVDIAPELGMDQTQRVLSEGGVGCAVGDYDNDGDLDLYVATYGRNLLYRNDGAGSFTEVGTQLGVAEPHSSVGAAWADYDNDGDLDLLAVGYSRIDGVQQPANRLYRNDGARFRNVISDYPQLDVGDHGVEWVDYDGDGDLDLSVTDGYGPEGGHYLFRNNLPSDQGEKAITALVLGAKGHFTAFGAEVRLYDQAGKVLATRLVPAGGGYNTQSATPIVLPLTSAALVTVEVTYMSASGPRKKTLKNVKPGSRPRDNGG